MERQTGKSSVRGASSKLKSERKKRSAVSALLIRYQVAQGLRGRKDRARIILDSEVPSPSKDRSEALKKFDAESIPTAIRELEAIIADLESGS